MKMAPRTKLPGKSKRPQPQIAKVPKTQSASHRKRSGHNNSTKADASSDASTTEENSSIAPVASGPLPVAGTRPLRTTFTSTSDTNGDKIPLAGVSTSFASPTAAEKLPVVKSLGEGKPLSRPRSRTQDTTTTSTSNSPPNVKTARKKRASLTNIEMSTKANTPAPSATPAPTVPTNEFITLDSISPFVFDIIPSTERILSRLLLPPAEPGTDVSVLSEHKRPLDIGHLDGAANPIRVKIGKAKTLISQLGDIDRTVEEQEEEIEELEARVKQQMASLKSLEALLKK